MTAPKSLGDLSTGRIMTSRTIRAVDGAVEFADALERLLEKLGSARVMLSLHMVAVHGLSEKSAEAVLRHAGGDRAEAFRLEPNVHLVLFLGPDDRLLRGGNFADRLGERLPHLSAGGEIVLRSLARWNHEIADPYYLLDQLLAAPPRHLAPPRALVA